MIMPRPASAERFGTSGSTQQLYPSASLAPSPERTDAALALKRRPMIAGAAVMVPMPSRSAAIALIRRRDAADQHHARWLSLVLMNAS